MMFVIVEPSHLEPELEITNRDFKFKNSSSETRMELSFMGEMMAYLIYLIKS